MYLYGASGHAKVIIEILEKLGKEVTGLFDDNPEIKQLMGYQVFGTYVSSKHFVDQLIISIGDNELRKKLSELHSFNYGQAIHPSTFISPRALLGEGTVVMANATINTGTRIGVHVIINTAASIDHDCIVGDFVHISPNATLCGGVHIGDGTHIGAATVIIPGIKIGKWATIGAGSVIIRDVQDGAKIVGNPGHLM